MQETGKAGWQGVGPASDFAENAVRTIEVAGRRLAVGRHGATFFAVDDRCPHAGGSLGEGLIDDDCVICPVHGFAFHCHSGASDDHPATVETFEVRVEDGMVEVRVSES
jgi:nitrite reductase/ring-hydroxylating ferredoxin subunit